MSWRLGARDRDVKHPGPVAQRIEQQTSNLRAEVRLLPGPSPRTAAKGWFSLREVVAGHRRGQHTGQQDVSIRPLTRGCAWRSKLDCYRKGGGCLQRREPSPNTRHILRFSSVAGLVRGESRRSVIHGREDARLRECAGVSLDENDLRGVSQSGGRRLNGKPLTSTDITCCDGNAGQAPAAPRRRSWSRARSGLWPRGLS